MARVSEVASTFIEIPRFELKDAEKLGSVNAMLVAKEKSDAEILPVSTTTSKLTIQTKDSSRRCVSRLEVEKVTTKLCIALSDTPSEVANVDLSASMLLVVGSFSVSMATDTRIIATSLPVGSEEGDDDGTIEGSAVGSGDGPRLLEGDDEGNIEGTFVC